MLAYYSFKPKLWCAWTPRFGCTAPPPEDGGFLYVRCCWFDNAFDAPIKRDKRYLRSPPFFFARRFTLSLEGNVPCSPGKASAHLFSDWTCPWTSLQPGDKLNHLRSAETTFSSGVELQYDAFCLSLHFYIKFKDFLLCFGWFDYPTS